MLSELIKKQLAEYLQRKGGQVISGRGNGRRIKMTGFETDTRHTNHNGKARYMNNMARGIKA